MYVVLGVKPEPSKAAAAELVSWKPTFACESPVARRLPTEPVQAAWSVWLSVVVPESKTRNPPTMAERFRFRPDHAKAIRVAAVDVTKVTGVRSAVREPGPTSTTVPWKFAGMRMPAFATLEYVVSKIVSPTVLTPGHCAGSRT